jgi:hypothetical protein
MEEVGQWPVYAARLFRYAHFEAYYHNIVYTSLVRYTSQHRENEGLYKHIRGIYNPVQRLVDLYVAKVYGGPLDLETLDGGAIPFAGLDDRLRTAILQTYTWSNWATKKSLYVRHGAMKGDTAIKIVDDRVRQQVRLEVLDPSKIKAVDRDEMGNAQSVEIEYERDDPVTGKSYTYTEIITPQWFYTFKDGEPFAYVDDLTGEPVSEWPNEYGFVPLVVVEHKDLDLGWGANAFHSQVRKIDELNDGASLLNDQLRKTINPVWYFAGVTKADDLDASADDKDEMSAIYGPADSEPAAMVANIDAVAAGENLQAMLAELERDMPELALHRLREAGNLTAPGVRAGYSDAIDRIVEARGNYDDGQVRALLMALAIGGYNNYRGFEGFDLGVVTSGAVDFHIAERPVIKDSLTRQQRLDYLLQSKAPATAVWTELEVDEQTQNKWLDELASDRAAFDARLDADLENAL